jgi:hypothetical protein
MGNALCAANWPTKKQKRGHQGQRDKRVDEELRTGLGVPPESVGVCWNPENDSTFIEQIRVD